MIFALGQVAVHKTVKMTTHIGLALRFCTRCGAHGQNRSNYLNFVCKKPTAAGVEALRCIRQGFQPSRYQQAHLDRRNLKVWLGARKFKARKPKETMLKHHAVRRLRLSRKRKPLSTPGAFSSEVIYMHKPDLRLAIPSSTHFPTSAVEGDGSHHRDQHVEGVAPPPPQAREPWRSRASSFLPARACRRHESGGTWNMLDPCVDCIALAFQQEAVNSEVDCKQVSTSPAPDSRGTVDQDACGVPRDPLESLGTPAPLGAPSPLLACPRHRRGGGWSILDPCQDCLDLAMQASL